ncbi:MAG: hypothetical protein RLZZ399_1375 [Verrucomicrobiota bacterium]|jgi:uncharacterized protein (DUF2267 family)
MSAQHLEVFDTTIHKTHQWIDALADEVHLDPHAAYQVLRAVLQTLRDRLPVQEAAHFGAQLPMLVRGLFYEGWRPSDLPVALDRQAFLRRISENITSSRIVDPLEATRAVLVILDRFLGAGELEKISRILPAELRSLFPANTPAGKKS